MAIALIDDRPNVDARRLQLDRIRIKPVDQTGELLDACHDLLLRVFDPAVVDPKEIYVNAVSDRKGAFRDFEPLFFAAMFDVEGQSLLVGFISSDLMTIGESDNVHLAMGNVATSPKMLRRGVGKALFNAAVHAARAAAESRGKRLKYSTSEAETDSLPFWVRLGFRWPENVQYFQPPLDFDDEGTPVFPEVPETFVVKTFDGGTMGIDAAELTDIVRSIYWNWSLRPHAQTLSPAAMAKARDYVMGGVLQKTLASIPNKGIIPLVEPPRPN